VTNFFFRVICRVKRFVFVRELVNRIKYPSIGLGSNANMAIDGQFNYGLNCSIAENCNIIVAKQATLKLGDGCYIGRYVELGPSGRIEIGSHTSLQDRCILVGDIKVGRYCLISLNVLISSGRHYFDVQPSALIRDQDHWCLSNKEISSTLSQPVTIEEDCWLGVNTVLMPGVTIGKGAIVGANSVVTKDVEPYAVVAGAPAKIIRRRLNFSPPRLIFHDNPEHWPYFYSGFEVARAERERSFSYGGMSTSTEFEVCLDSSNGKFIGLNVKSLFSQSGTLSFMGQVKEVSNEWDEVVFDISMISGNRFKFSADLENSKSKLIISKIWID